MADTASGCIVISGARTNNLKNVSLTIPRQQLVVFTGRSGSGKSSLAIDTLFAEGQRQYIESLSIYSRQFFSQLPRADVDRIDGLQPTLAVAQHRFRSNRRSTVGTLTEIYDFLRLLMARAGEVHCSGCGELIQQQTPAEIRDRILDLPLRSKVMILSPVAVDQAGAHQDTIRSIRSEGLVRVRVDGEICDIENIPVLDPNKKHTIEAVADRIIVREGIEGRLLEAIDSAVRISSDGQVVCCWLPPDETNWQEKLYSTRFACPACDIYYAEVQPRSFSFNSPLGACETCLGIGTFSQFEPDSVIDRRLSVADGAVIAWQRLPAAQRKKQSKWLEPILSYVGIDNDTPLSLLNDELFDQFMNRHSKDSPGLSLVLEKELATTTSEDRLDELESMRGEVACGECKGARVSRQARSIFLQGRHIGNLVNLPLIELANFFAGLEFQDEKHQAIAEPIVSEINHRLRFLQNVGVGYLSLGRAADSLSGGEHQRVRLAAAVGAGVTGVCFVLDEPSTGLHARDTQRLLETLRHIQSAGNSVVVVEHDDEMINSADHIVEIGPGAGTRGGEVVATGSPAEIKNSSDSLTGPFLSGENRIVRNSKREVDLSKAIAIKGAAGNNLKNVDVDIPLEVLCVVSGVSGSGKSTLIAQTLVPAIRRHFELLSMKPAKHESISGLEQIDHFVVVDQKPIGRSPRACPATFCGLLDEFRKLFVATKAAKQLGFGKGRFTFNAKSGWCPNCHGLGHRKVEMSFMPDVFVKCEMCQGRRFNLQTLQVKFAGNSMADVLEMTIDEAAQAFNNFSKIKTVLDVLVDVGLGYLKLGQSATTLSGGEAQRLKLARQLAVQATDVRKTLFILDEPTSGLHSADVQSLLNVLDRLVQSGHSVLVIEHHLDVIRNADWVIDLGPDGGEAGGHVIAACRPIDLPQATDSITGRWLVN
jgi:excinuclease ABC subunit A